MSENFFFSSSVSSRFLEICWSLRASLNCFSLHLDLMNSLRSSRTSSRTCRLASAERDDQRSLILA